MSAAETPTTFPSPPMRADARRNRERLLTVARAAFTVHGTDASLDDIARQAGVGIGTLYRHFPTRQALLEAVFRDWIEALIAEADDLLAESAPADALAAWLRGVVVHVTAYQGLAAALMASFSDESSELFGTCEAMTAAGAALLTRAQQAGEIRPDTGIADVLKLVNGIAVATELAPDGAAQADRLLGLVMDGLRASGQGSGVRSRG